MRIPTKSLGDAPVNNCTEYKRHEEIEGDVVIGITEDHCDMCELLNYGLFSTTVPKSYRGAYEYIDSTVQLNRCKRYRFKS